MENKSFKKRISVFFMLITSIILIAFFVVFIIAMNISIHYSSVVPATPTYPAKSSNVGEIINSMPATMTENSHIVPIINNNIINRVAIVGGISLFILILLSFILSMILSKLMLRPLLVQVKDIVSHKEVTEYKELMQIKEEYFRTYENEKKLVNEKSKYTAYTSHELRNFLTLLSTKIDILGDDNPKTTLANIKENVDAFKITIEDLMSYENLSDEDIPLEHVQLDLCVAKVIDEYIQIGTIIRFNYDEEQEYDVLSRNAWIERAVSNLISNAKNHSKADQAIDISIKCTEKDVIIAVENQGKIIPKEELNNLFKPYYTTDPNGRGLGLAFVKQITEKSGGAVSVKSDNSNTKFILVFPRGE